MNKYHNQPTAIGNTLYSSKKEANRAGELELLERAGEIRNLVKQPRYELQKAFDDDDGNHHKPIFYVADFSYLDKKYKWELVVEDVKSEATKTPLYRLKKKLFLFRYPCHFLET